jgi:predicted O-methyltransferase YrrM
MKKAIKALLRWSMPVVAERIHTIRLRKHIDLIVRERGLDRLASEFVKKHGAKVQAGPFAGMTYVDRASSSMFLPKLIGSYEAELHSIIEGIIARPYRTIVDVGCAEGYYAIGLARQIPGVMVYAYDIDDAARDQCRQFAALNELSDRVQVYGRCDPAELERRLQPPSLLICDCEGYEYVLLDPQAAPKLRQTDILVEFHEGQRRGVTQAIRDRFSGTHEFQMIDQQTREPAKYPILRALPVSDQVLAVDEMRGSPQQWAWMTVRT